MLVATPQHTAPQNAPGTLALTVDTAQSAVHWVLGSSLHAVHGTFALKRGSFQIDPVTGKASGEIVVDATSGKSGNDGRDRKMHKDVLESARFGEIVFRPDNIAGKFATQGDFTVRVHGIFLLHGSEHELNVPVQASLTGDRWTATAKLSVPFIEWGLKNPSTWLFKVDHSVDVELDLRGMVEAQTTQYGRTISLPSEFSRQEDFRFIRSGFPFRAGPSNQCLSSVLA